MTESETRVRPWSEIEPPTEVAIRRVLGEEKLHPYGWSNDAGDVYGSHAHAYHKVIYVVTGSITFGFPKTGGQVTLRPGDRLDLPPNVLHSAVVGPQGVVCLEAHRPA